MLNRAPNRALEGGPFLRSFFVIGTSLTNVVTPVQYEGSHTTDVRVDGVKILRNCR